MGQTAVLERIKGGLPRSLAEQFRAEIAATGLGPVEIRRNPDGSDFGYILNMRIGPFRRIATTEAEARALLEERQACFF